MSEFVDRERELAVLEELWRTPGAQLVVVYGRRRVGKTALVRRFLVGKRGVYHMCTLDTIEWNLREMLRALAEAVGDFKISALEPRLDVLLRVLAEVASDRFVFVVDEFPYCAAVYPPMASVIQRAWDMWLSQTNVFVVLVGSSIGMMSEHVLSRKAPLYGRRTGNIRLGELEPHYVGSFVGGGVEDWFKAWAVVGGVPYYLRLFVPGRPVDLEVRRLFSKGGPLYEEPLFLLREELREPRVYVALLEALAAGRTRLGEVAQFAGLSSPKASKYLWKLRQLDIVGREEVYGARRSGRYYIKDNLFAFWFRFVYPNLSKLELDQPEAVFTEERLDAYYGEMFERFVRQISPRVFGVQLYKYVKGQIDIDLTGKSNGCRIYGEVKWSREADPVQEYKRLANIKQGDVYLVVARGFSKPPPEGVVAVTLGDIYDALKSGKKIPLCSRKP
ncbi:MAG: ATP-binding protein [Pyrobaculum sp.]